MKEDKKVKIFDGLSGLVSYSEKFNEILNNKCVEDILPTKNLVGNTVVIEEVGDGEKVSVIASDNDNFLGLGT